MKTFSLFVFFAVVTITTMSIILVQHADAFQLVAGPVEIYVSPGETKSFSWRLVAAHNETSTLKIYSDGNGSEFLSIPASFKLVPGVINYVVGNVTIPANYPTNTLLNPIVHSTISENETANSKGNAVNVELSKMLTLIIGGNTTGPASSRQPSTITPKHIQLGLLINGTINSLITTPTTKWIASGNFSLDVEDGNITFFETKMLWNNVNGTDTHTHEFLNLRNDNPILLNTSKKNVSVKGLMDVGTNGRVVWKDVPSTIDIYGKKTISISLDDDKTNHHFASQAVLGVIDSFIFCSDTPGPDMQVLATCTEPSSMSSASTLSNDSSNGFQSNNPSQVTSGFYSEPKSDSQFQAQSQSSVSNPISNDSFGGDYTSSSNNPNDENILTYENNPLGFKVNYLPNWKLNEAGLNNHLFDAVAQLSSPDDDSSLTMGQRRSEGLETTAGDFANTSLSNYESFINGFQSTVYNPDRELSGNPSYQIEGTYLDNNLVKRYLVETGILYNNKVYVFLFNASESAYQDLLPAVSDIVQSVQFLPSSSNTPLLESNDLSTNQPSQNCEEVYSANATANGFETDPNDYNPPGDAIDGDLKTWWANKKVPSWLQINLQKGITLCSVEISWNKGTERAYKFDIATSTDGNIFTDVFNGKSTGNTEGYEKYDIDNFSSDVKSVKLTITDSSSKKGWVSIKEIKLIGR